VLNFDRRSAGTFTKTFEAILSTRSAPAGINMGRQMLSRHAALLGAGRQHFGVPPIVVAIWGAGEALSGQGRHRRCGDPHARHHGSGLPPTELFSRASCWAALKTAASATCLLARILNRAPVGRESGQTQFLPSVLHQIRRRFRRQRPMSTPPHVPDVLASTANLFAHESASGWSALWRGAQRISSDARV